MAKFYGEVGFEVTEETSPGIWKEIIRRENYSGDLIRRSRRLDAEDKVNHDVRFMSDISIVADPFAYKNFASIRYVEYLGTKWEVSEVDVQYPRLILSTGGLYHENTVRSS